MPSATSEWTLIDEWLAVALRDTSPMPRAPDVAPNLLVARARFHGVVALIADTPALLDMLPDGHVHALKLEAQNLAFWELGHQVQLRALAHACQAEGINALVLKGTALAYSVYAKPAHRARGDTDLLVRPDDQRAVQRILQSLDYRRWIEPGGEVLSCEATFAKHDANGLEHVIDLHWHPNNHAALNKVMPHEALWDGARALPGLGDGLYMADPVEALLFACMHRFTHLDRPIEVDGVAHDSAERLIWLIDVKLLAHGFDQTDWARLVSRANETGLASACATSFAAAHRLLAANIPDDVMRVLRAAPKNTYPMTYLAARPALKHWMNFVATSGLRPKAQFLRELCFPSEAFMRARFETAGRREPLGRLYLRRGLRGLRKLFQSRGPTL